MPSDELNIESLRRSLSHRVVGCRLLHYDTLSSTMDEAKRLAELGEPDGTVVIAEEQTSARGRFDRAWVSPRGKDLVFSVLLRPTAAQLPYVNMAATLAVYRSVAGLTGLATAIKWPNDVRILGHKVSGILVETAMEGLELDYAVVGIGVNVNLDPSQSPEIASTATSISRETGREGDRTTVLRILLEHFDDLYRGVKQGRSLTQDWSACLETLGRAVQVRWQDQVLEGRAEAVDEQGNLILKRADGAILKATAGEVTLQT